MPDTNTAAAASFQNAEAYEQVMGRWSRRLAPLLIRFGGLSDGDRVLDVGCGTGSLTFTLPEIANVATVTGIDLTESFVEFARARNTNPRISFQPADARVLPFEDRVQYLYAHRGEHFANAREVRTLYERTLERQARRLAQQPTADPVILLPEDIGPTDIGTA